MKSRFFRGLPLALLLLSAPLSGCATSSSPATGAPQKHIHSAWRYKHMNHMHTRPSSKDHKPSVEGCAIASKLGASAPTLPSVKGKVRTPD